MVADPLVTERVQHLAVDFLKEALAAPASPVAPHVTAR